jgi:hypothetical protein
LGKSIIGLLLAVAVPSVILLWMVIKGMAQDKATLYYLGKFSGFRLAYS